MLIISRFSGSAKLQYFINALITNPGIPAMRHGNV